MAFGYAQDASLPPDYLNEPLYQDIVPASPDVASLGQYCDMPINTFNGLAQISIPFYEIAFDEITIPISISYHGIGVRVNEEASRVGLGWTLNAGGVITQQIQGKSDLSNNPDRCWIRLSENIFPDLTFYGVDSDGPDYSGLTNATAQTEMENYSLLAYEGTVDCSQLHNSDSYSNILNEDAFPNIYLNKIADKDGSDYNIDAQPDIFSFNFAGYSGKFILDRDGNSQTIDDSPIEFSFSSANNICTAKTIDGYEYVFELAEIAQLNNPSQSLREKNRSFFLKEIHSPNSHQKVTFYYDRNVSFHTTQFTHNVSFIDKVYTSEHRWEYCNESNSLGGFDAIESNTRYDTKLLTKIEFPGGEIGFVYSSSKRQDIKSDATHGDYKLDAIRVLNSDKELISTISLQNNSYFTSSLPYNVTNYPSAYSYLTKRLKLDGISINNKIYSFDYYSGELPYKNSFQRDYWGFYNGASENDDYPNGTYYNDGVLAPNNWRFVWYGVNESILDLCDGGYNNGLVRGFANRAPSLNHSKQCMLQSITYPTGATTSFEYELNQFQPYTVQGLEEDNNPNDPAGTGGGLRVSKITKTGNSGDEEVITYTYSNGILLNPPFFSTISPLSTQSYRTCSGYFQTVGQSTVTITGSSKFSPSLMTKGGLVGYQNIEILTENNSNATSPERNLVKTELAYFVDFPGEYHMAVVHNEAKLQYRPQSIPINTDPLTGSLTDKTEYAYSNIDGFKKINETQYIYDFAHVLDIWGIVGQEHADFADNGHNTLLGSGYLYKIKCARSFLYRVEETEYDAHENATNTIYKTFEYDDNTYQKTCEYVGTRSGYDNIAKTEYKYPQDLESSSNVYSEMVAAGILSPVIEKTNYRDDVFVSKEATIYDRYDKNKTIYKPTEQQLYTRTSSHRTLIKDIKYDYMGNVSEYTNEQKLKRSFIYGYKNNVLIAEFTDAEDNDVGYCGFESNKCIEGNSLYINNFWSMYCNQDSTSIPFANDPLVIYNDVNYFSSGVVHSGKYCRVVGGEYGPTKSFIPSNQSDKYIFSGWFKSNGGESGLGANIVNAETNEYLDTWSSTFTTSGSDWEYHQMVIDLSRYSGTVKIICFPWNHSHNLTDNPALMLVDDLLFHPARSTYTYYTYKPLVGVTSKTNTNRLSEYFEYDQYGRLIEHRNDDKKVLQQAEYHYYNE